ncbi:MAG: hypothetical protein QNJ62_06310 [Methyloceanibacter sp.]|nr:hypothetical protein [Methyloceanibacter sp.]
MRTEKSTHSSAKARRRRVAAKATLAVSAALIALVGASEVRDAVSTMERDGIAHTLRQSAWNTALSGQSVAEAWPWQNVSSRMSPLPSAKVQRLGLSASLRDMSEVASEFEAPRNESGSLASATSGPHAVEGDVALGDIGSGKVGIGDSITFTANDGATCVYRVTGRPVVDPHLGSGQAQGTRGEAGLFDCSPLDSLIMQATQKSQETAPSGRTADHQRKL